MLGNLYGCKDDPETANKLIREALELNAKDQRASNSIANFTQTPVLDEKIAKIT